MQRISLSPGESGRSRWLALAVGLAAALAGCGQEPPSSANTPAATETSAAAETPPLQATSSTWTPEALEELIAPVALYPDVILLQVLMAATNPQEVLDAGNWLLQNNSLTGKALDEAAQKAGFTPPTLALIHFPQVVDMMCREMNWTTELGQAYVNDQTSVLAAAQRLRMQAKDVGNLKTSPEMTVATETKNGEEIVIISPPKSQLVAVPQYDPVAVYAPAPAAAVPATTTTVVQQDTGHSTGTLITTGLLAFGAGILVSNLFDDDDHYNNNYYGGGGYWYRPPPPYPPYPYRPSYGNGFYPSNGYRPPGGNNTVIINNNNNYWNRYSGAPGARPKDGPRSPITAARPNRPATRSATLPANRDANSWKGQSTYAGAQPGTKRQTAGSKASTGRPQPKVQGSYAGARPNNTTSSSTRPAMPSGASRPNSSRTPSGAVDYGRQPSNSRQPIQAGSTQRPSNSVERTNGSNRNRSTAMSDTGAASDRAASQRGRQSLSKGTSSRDRGGNQGGNRSQGGRSR